mgnify:FL=1
MEPWQTLSSRLIFEQQPWIRVEARDLQLPDGQLIRDWIWLDTPNFVIVAAQDPESRFLVFEQTKYAVQGVTLAPVGGYIRPGEDPLAAAQRELKEETGCEAKDWTFLGAFATDANRGNGTGFYYLARGASQTGPVDSDDLEEQHLLLLTPAELKQALLDARVKVITWQACLAMALLRC